MGIIIEAAGPNKHPPYDVRVTLKCDEPERSLLCNGSDSFTDGNGYIGCHAKAMDAGWLERQHAQGRLWICPSCSGKKVA
jgi:hypothetical protein